MVVTITREEVLAVAEVNDECSVDFRLVDTLVTIPSALAREIADELLAAADEADTAAIEYATRPVEPSGFDVDVPVSRTTFSGEVRP